MGFYRRQFQKLYRRFRDHEEHPEDIDRNVGNARPDQRLARRCRPGDPRRVDRPIRHLGESLPVRLITEDEEDKQPDGPADAEGREVRRLLGRASIVDYLMEAEGQEALAGASKELRMATMGQDLPGYMPLEMLEHRVDAVSDIAAAVQNNQQTIAPRVFNRGALAYLGVQTPSVPVGTVSYPRLTAGTAADVRDDGVELDGTAATLTTEEINPVRLTASYTYGTETLQRIRGFEEALRADLQETLQDKRDELGINGQAEVANTSPAIEGIINSLTNPSNPTAIATYADYLAAFDSMVDGKYALSGEEVRLLVNADTWQQAMGLVVPSGSGGNMLFREYLPSARFRVSGNMPATPNNNFATALAVATGAPARGFFLPTWSGVQLIPDPYTLAKKGQRLLTAIMMVGFQMIDSASYRRLEFQVA